MNTLPTFVFYISMSDGKDIPLLNWLHLVGLGSEEETEREEEKKGNVCGKTVEFPIFVDKVALSKTDCNGALPKVR